MIVTKNVFIDKDDARKRPSSASQSSLMLFNSDMSELNEEDFGSDQASIADWAELLQPMDDVNMFKIMNLDLQVPEMEDDILN